MRRLRFRRLIRSGGVSAFVGVLVLLLLVVVAVFPGRFAHGNPMIGDPFHRLRPPSLVHPFGTDDVGRDLYTRVVYGAGLSLRAAGEVLVLASLIGTLLGVLGGYVGGWLDEGVMRITDIFLAFPYLVLAMAMVAAIGPSLEHATLALSLVWWAQYARLMRIEVRRVKRREFVEAAYALGGRVGRVVVRHVLPNSLTPLIVKITLDLGLAILMLASLSFIGLGPPPPTPEWGSMVATGRNYLFGYWWYPTFPGLAIFVTVMASNLVGDWLRDLLDPRLATLETPR